MAPVQSVRELDEMLVDSLGAGQIPNGKASYVADFAKIASLMTDKVACHTGLAALNSKIIVRAEAAHLRKRNWKQQYKDSLKSETFKYTRTDGSQISGRFKKHGNILKEYLDVWEGEFGFNKVSHSEDGRPSLPGATPLLTGFVQPNDFRKYLLKHGYHWTDIGVAERHGEFTHRLHWYIICAKSAAEPNWLTNQPLQLFIECGEDWTVKARGETLWDWTLDFLDRENPDVGYRNPENLHAFLTDDVTCKRKDLWAVAQIIRSRKRRVVSINEGSGLGKPRLDSDLEARQEEHDEKLLKRGDESSKIVWQNIQEGRDTSLMDEFLRL